MKITLILFFFIISDNCLATIATASLFPATRIINPAAITGRHYSGYSINASKKDTTSNMLVDDLTVGDLNWNSETTIEGMDINLFGGTKLLNIEFYTSPTRGKKTITNTRLDNSSSRENELSTVALHFLASLKLNKFFSFGVKRTKSASEFENRIEDTSTSYSYSSYSKNDVEIDTSGYGLNINLYKEKLFLGFGIEEINFKNIFTTEYSATYDGSDDSSNTSAGVDELKTKKTFYGIAFISGKIKNYGMKLEVSRETMPPLFEGLVGIKDGEATTYATEMNTRLFLAGASYRRVRGYYIDTYQLVPFFLNIEQIGNSFRDEFEFSFSLKLSKGGTFGIIALFSEENTRERVDSFYDQLYPVNKKTNYYGLSYSHIF